MTLTDFLLARIAEDEADAKVVQMNPPPRIGPPFTHAARVRAECEAKRQIVAIWDGAMSGLDDRIHDLGSHSLRALALPYADHPDYDESWRA